MLPCTRTLIADYRNAAILSIGGISS